MTTCINAPDGRERLSFASVIPSLGMTFTEAADRVRELVYEGDNVPNDPDGERCDELHAEWSPIRDTILTSQPRTDADVLAKLDILLHPSIGLATGMICAAEFQAVQQIREVIAAGLGGLQAANDAADAFGDTVAAIAGEAFAPLAIPQTPTDAMVAAGAAAAGVTPEQFAAGFAAAVEAYALERVA